MKQHTLYNLFSLYSGTINTTIISGSI